ncbi:MAG: hypothetical protein R2711_18680 [Acidimicrobiales bacterium]
MVRADWVEHLADYHPDEDYRTGYAARRELGGGVLLTQIHLPDLLHHLVGPFRSVRAVGGQLTHLELDVDDSVTFLATAADDLAVTGHLDYVGRPKRSILELRGTAGWATADLVAGTLAVQRSDPLGPVDVQDHPIERNDLFVATMADFLDACAQRRAPRCSLDDAVAVLELTDAIRASMAGGGDVAVGRA